MSYPRPICHTIYIYRHTYMYKIIFTCTHIVIAALETALGHCGIGFISRASISFETATFFFCNCSVGLTPELPYIYVYVCMCVRKKGRLRARARVLAHACMYILVLMLLQNHAANIRKYINTHVHTFTVHNTLHIYTYIHKYVYMCIIDCICM